MGEVIVSCPFCGISFKVPSERLSGLGTKGACRSCRAPLTVYPDGRVFSTEAGAEVLAAQGTPPPRPEEPSPPPSVLPGDGQAFRFACPSCGKEYAIPKSRVPGTGIRGACTACGVSLILQPDGRVEAESAPALSLPKEAAAPAPEAERGAPQGHPLIETPPAAPWDIQMEGETLGPFPFADMKQLILADRLPPDRLIRSGGSDWAPAASFALLAPHFAPHERGEGPTEESFGSEDRCFQHPGTDSAYRCSDCQRHMCTACIKGLRTHDGRKTIPVCPACGAPCVPLKKRARWTPFFKDLGQVFLSPFVGSAWMVFGFLVIMEFLKGIMGCLGFVLLGSLQMTFYLHVVRKVAEGSYEMPEWPDKDNWLDMFSDLLKVFVVSIITLIPLILTGVLVGSGFFSVLMLASRGNMTGSGLAMGPLAVLFFALAAGYVLYLPICIAIVAVFQTVLPAFNPFLIVKIISRIGTPYFCAAALWVAFTIIRLVLSSLAQRVVGLNLLAPSVLAVYFTLLNAYVLGRVIYENEDKIGWS